MVKKGLKMLGSLLLYMVLFVAITLNITGTVSTNVVVGQSMEPNLYDGDYLLAYTRLKVEDLKYEDIVIVDNDRLIIKRIVGLPNDKIKFIDGQLYRNDILIDEEYINQKDKDTYTDIEELTVGENEIYVCGDNRNHSNDSRAIGVIPMDKFKGKIIFRLPLSIFKRLFK